MRATDPPWPEILGRLGLSPEDLDPVAGFVLLHSLLDKWLAHALALSEFRELMKYFLPNATEDIDVQGLLDRFYGQHSEGTFGRRLELVRKRGLLSKDHLAICDEVNRARNRFLHGRAGHSEIPRYKGTDVRQGGLEQCLSDVNQVIKAVQAERLAE